MAPSTEVAPGIHRLTLGIANWYLVQEADAVVVVDAGTPADWAQFLGTLGSIGRAPSDVRAVLLTHAHMDHTGFAERARTQAGTTVCIHEADAEAARRGKPGKMERSVLPYLGRRETYRTLFGLIRQKAMRMVPILELSTFADDEFLDLPGRPRVVHVPGHTPGSAAILFEDRGVVCTGDAMVMRNPLTGRIGPQVAPSALNWSTASALDSLGKFEGLPASIVLAGHGDPWTAGVGAAVAAARTAGRS